MELIDNIAKINAPYGKEVTLNNVSYENGFNLIRMRIKEGKRFTDMDLDKKTIEELNSLFSQWLTEQN